MNSNIEMKPSRKNLIARMGGRFVLHVQVISQLVSTITGPILGIFFIVITTNLVGRQITQFATILFATLVLINILHFIYASLVTRNARLQLDNIYKGKPLPEDFDPATAWKEIITLPRRSVVAQVILILTLVVTPVVFYMRANGNISPDQLVYIGIGGTISAISVLVLAFLFLDSQVAPARSVLLPLNPNVHDIHITLRQQPRQFIVNLVLMLTTSLMIGGLSYQKILAMLRPGADLPAIFSLFRIELIIAVIILLGLGMFLAARLAFAVSTPTQEIMRIMDRVETGKYDERAEIMTSDDMAHLTIRFNQMLQQLQATQESLERQVQERTAILETRGRQLQAAAQVASEGAAQRDLGTMLSRIATLISEQFAVYHAGIFMLDESGEYAVLQAASSEGGRRMLERGHRLMVGQQGIVGSAAFHKQPRIAQNVGADREFFNNPDLPVTKSEAAIPLRVSNEVIGVLDIQSAEENKFQQADIEVLQILADQLALAIQNARLIAESRDAIARLEATTGQNLRRTWRERLRDVRNAYRYTSTGLIPAARQENQKTLNIAGKDYLSIPINLRGQRIGAISLHRKGESGWSESDRSLINEVAAQVGLALENARLVQDTQLRAEREQTLSQMTSRIRETLDLDAVLQTAVRELKQSFDLDQAEVRLQLADQPDSNTQQRQS